MRFSAVSIGTRKLWGKEEARTPLNERQIRGVRLRHALGLDVGRVLPLSFGVSGALFAVPVYIGVLMERPPLMGPQMSVVEQVWQDSISAMPTLLTVFGSMLLLFWFMPAIGRWMFDVFGKKHLTLETLTRRRRQRAWGRARRGHFIGWACVTYVGAIVLACFYPTLGGLLAILGAWAFAVSGVFGIMVGVTARRGRVLVCARCDHGMRSWRSAAEKCAECGCEWKKPWGARVGAKRVWWGQVWVGVGSLVAAAAMVGAALMLMSRR